MGGKKGKKGKGQEDEENPTENFFGLYKKCCREFETQASPTLLNKIEECIDEGEDLNEILISEKIGEFGARALSKALSNSTKDGKGFPILKALRIWEADIGDEGVRELHQFIINTNNASLSLMEFLNCNIGPLGCEFISRVFEPSLPGNIQYLTLDYNVFGNEGLNNLLTYLPMNASLTTLSLGYCGIDEKGVQFFEKYITSTKTLEKLILMGNPIKDEGVTSLCSYLLNNESVEDINLNNTSFGQSEDTINKLTFLLENNKNILLYHVKFNLISEKNFLNIIQSLKSENGKHVYQFNLDEKYPKETFDLYFKAMKGRKLKKKKKKGGKKKKKK